MKNVNNADVAEDAVATSARKSAKSINSKIQPSMSLLHGHSTRTNFTLFRSLLGDTMFFTVLIIGLILGLVQESAASPLSASQEDVSRVIYKNAWTVKSPVFSRDLKQLDKHYYYQTVEFTVSTAGTYTFASRSKMNSYGYIYDVEFNPHNPVLNLISQDDDSDGKGQFRIKATLHPGHKYTLVATTFSPETIGEFSIVSSGPAYVHVRFDGQKKVVPDTRSIVGEIRATTNFSGVLTLSSQIFHRPEGDDDENYYFQAIQVSASAAGTYTFTSSSSLDTIGYFYDVYFDPSNPLVNLITDDDDSAFESFQFRIQAYLQTGKVYVLVVTTHGSSERGSFRVSATGPGTANLVSITPTTSIPIITLSTAPPMSSSYSGALSSSSPSFNRPETSSDEFFYYQALQITASRAGSYIFTSDSDMDTIGYFYSGSFDPSNPSINLITDDDDSGDISLQFRIQVYLQTGVTYILVVTTHSEDVRGDFSVSAFGPTAISMIAFTPSTSRPIVTQSTAPSVSSSFSTTLSPSSPVFSRPDADDEYFYFQAIQVSISTTGNYVFQSDSTIDTMGYFYRNSFDPSMSSTNLITEDDDDGDIDFQFRIEVYLQAGTTYILVVTTHREYDKGNVSISAAGPAAVGLTSITASTSRPIVTPTTTSSIASSYSSALSAASPVFYRPEGEENTLYYFQAIQVTVSTSGNYILTSDSLIDTMGYFYAPSFDASAPLTNLITDDDDGGDAILQFRIQIFLQANRTYVLIVTSHREAVTGSFRVLASGPATVRLVEIRTSTSRPIFTLTTTGFTLSSFAGTLSSNSPVFYRPQSTTTGYYYLQAIQVSVSRTGLYVFTTNSTIDTRGYLYGNAFDPSDPTINLITSDDDTGGSFQFRIQAFLQASSTYIIVVTTHREYITGDFALKVSGQASVGLTTITPITSRPITTQSTTPSISSSYVGELSSSSAIFYRPDGSTSGYYYFQALQVTVSTAATYVFTSNSTIDTIGYFYNNSFDPSDPLTNLILKNDDGGFSLQFRIEVYLETSRTYVLVVSTHREKIMGNFSVSAKGIASVTLTPITPSTSRPITTPPTTTSIPSSYSSSISSNSPTFSRPEGTAGQQYYFQVVKVFASTSGTYSFKSVGTIDFIGYIYQNSFDPFNPTTNLLTKDDDSGGSLQFRIQMFLQAGRTYFLVVTTHSASITGNFSLQVGGPAPVALTSFAITTTPATTTVTTIPSILSTYMNAFWSASPKYNRPNTDNKDFYYYDTIEVSVILTSNYVVTSKSYFNAVGYLYQNSFDPSNPTSNLLITADTVGANAEFKMDVTLETGSTYILVVTTSKPSSMGVFWVWARGRAPVTLISSKSSGGSTEFPNTTKLPVNTTPKSSALVTTSTITSIIMCMLIVLAL